MEYSTNMSLKGAPMQFATFTPVQYTAQTPDPTLLPESLLVQKGMQKEANESLDAIDTTFTKLRDALNVSEHDWLDSKANKIRAKIDRQIELGNYETAIRFAQESARDLKRDTDLQNKIKVNWLYNQERNRIQNIGIDALTQKYWDYRNQYSYNGTADWKPSWTPTKDINLSNLQSLAGQLTAEDVKSTTNGGNNTSQVLLDSEGNVTKDLTQAVGVRNTTSRNDNSSKTTHDKSKEDMTKTFRALLADSNVSAALGQKFDVTIWAYDDYEAKSKDMSLNEKDRNYYAEQAKRLKSELKDNNGAIIRDYDRWVEKKVIPMFENMEYHNISTTEQHGSGTEYSSSFLANNIQKITNNVPETEEVQTEGTTGIFQYKYVQPTYDASNFDSLFESEKKTKDKDVKIPYAI